MEASELFDTPLVEEPRFLSVSRITANIKRCLEDGFPDARVVGEISNFRRPASGHMYLTLKDEQAQLKVVMFRGMQKGLRFEPADGLKVRVTGGITVYGPRGDYQLIARSMMLDGLGPLQQAFIKLKEKLGAQGLFDPDIKKPIPAYPSRIAIVTSPTGAAVMDMLKMIRSRNRGVDVVIYPVRVQGDEAAGEIAQAIYQLNEIGGPDRLSETDSPDQRRETGDSDQTSGVGGSDQASGIGGIDQEMGGFDTIIVGRGGGSIEDLWAFNEEIVARAIHASEIPVISAVGHEIDFTIADLVADRRALTPTEAGEIVVPDTRSLAAAVDAQADAALRALERLLEGMRGRLRLLTGSYAARRPVHLLREKAQRLDDVSARISLTLSHLFDGCLQQAKGVSGRLEAISPLAVLERGYSITLDSDGKTVRSAAQVGKGDILSTRFAEGTIESEVR